MVGEAGHMRQGGSSLMVQLVYRPTRFTKIQGFPGGSDGKEATCNAGDLASIPGSGRSPGEGKGYQLQYSGLENSMDCIAHGVAKSQTGLSDFHFDSFSATWEVQYYVCLSINFN